MDQRLMDSEAYTARVAEFATIRDKELAMIEEENLYLLKVEAARHEARLQEIATRLNNSREAIFTDFERRQEALTRFAMDLLSRGKDLPERFR
jgi:hypothetical protein